MRSTLILWLGLLGAALISAKPSGAADLVWIGGTGFWNAAGNWSPAQIPTAADNVWITNSGTYTVTVPAGSTATNNSLTLGGTSGTQTLAIDRAPLSLNGASVINPNGTLVLLVSQSIVTGPGSLQVNGSVNWANGTFSGTGELSINAGSQLAIGSGGVTLGRALNNNGSVTWSGGNLTISAGNAINNLAGAVFDITADGRLSGTATTPINNAGLWRLTAGTTGTTITAPANNSGSLQVLASSLSLNLGGTHSGNFSNAPGATLSFGGGNHVLSAGSFVTGQGAVNLSGAATLNAAGHFDTATTLGVTSGTATLASGCDVTGATLQINGNGGILLFDSAGSVGAITLSAGTLGGTSPVNVTGPLVLGGGTVTNALVTANGGLTITGNTTLNGTKLVNPAMALWSAGNITGANGAVITNLLGASFINTFDGNLGVGTGATPLFINAGTFAKTNGTAAAGATSVNFQFLNTGTVEVRTNTLRYALNQQTAGVTLLDGGGLSAQAQPVQLLGGSLVGTGLVTVANVQNVINSSSVSPGLPIGELDITGNYQQTSAGMLNIDIGGYAAGTDFDLVTVTAGGAGGVATLAGMVSISLANGFAPTNGASFAFLTASSRVGSFTVFNYPSNDIGMQLSYDATSATLKVTNLKPVVANPIADPTPGAYGAAFSFQFPANTFTDPDGDALTYTATGLPPGITFSAATRTFSGTPVEAGSFHIIVMATDSGTPSLAVTNGFTLTVNPAILTVVADPEAKTYGAPDPALTYTVSGLVLGDTSQSVLTGALARNPGQSVAGSPYAIVQGTLAANGNYFINFTGNAFSITPAPLLVTADSTAKVYGATDPAFSATYSGFVNGETPAVLSGTLLLTRAPSQNVGNYAIVPSGLTSLNYSISFVAGTLTITKAPLTVIADDKTKTYGSNDPLFTARELGFVNGDTATALQGTLTFTRAPGENVGNYAITPGGVSSGNYTITFTAGNLAIAKAALVVTAQSVSKTYGSTDPGFAVSYAGFVNSETAGVLGGNLQLARVPGENAGNYVITPSGLVSGNYDISFQLGTLTINPSALVITADAKAKTYGAADPALTFSVNGLQFTDTQASVLSGALTRAPGESVADSPYAIGQGTLTANGNYTVVFHGSTLAIAPATLTIAADAKTKVYGAADPPLTFTITGLQFSDTQAGVLTGGLTRTSGESVLGSPYAIRQGTLAANSNYTINFAANTMTITPAPVSVTADNKTKTYGAADPAFTAASSGLVNGDTAASLGTLVLARAPGENVGTYAITGSGLSSPNYVITFNSGNLTITPAALAITADDQTKTYGAVDPAFTATYAGLVNGDTAVALGGALSLSRASGENVGSYSITPSGVTSANYIIRFNPGTLSILKAPLSVTADNKTKTFAAADPVFTAAFAGFVNGETAAVLGGTLSLTRAPGEELGSYAITPAGLTSSNYAIAFNSGTLTIFAPAPVILSLSRVDVQNVALTWSAVSNATYRVQFTGELNPANWADLPGDVLARAATASKLDFLTTTNRFYRVQVLP